MKIYIGADFVPTDINRSAFENGDIHTLIGPKLYDMLCTTDLNIFNLEVPLTDSNTPIVKFGNNLKSPTKTVNAFKRIPSLFLTVCNNHCYDQGFEGLQSTMNVLEKHDIAYGGIGENIHAAEKPYIFTKDGVRLGIYMCTEHEFSCANDHRAGANPFDVLESFDHVESLVNQCDYVIVLYHGGKEFYQYPSPMLQRYCRKFIEKGAALVLCQHSHCIGSREDYKTGTIIYGQGNFVFHTSAFDELHDIVDNSLLIEVDIDDAGFHVSEIPLVQTEMGVRLASPEEAQLILESYKKRSKQCENAEFIIENYKQFADTHINRYLREFLGRTWIIKIINGLTRRKLVSLLLGKTSYLGIQNFIECEAHHELFLQGLKNINRK